MLDEMTARQFDEWRIYEQIEPWSQDRMHALLARLTVIVANIMRASGTQPVTIYDCLPWLAKPPPPSDEELEAKIEAQLTALD